MQELIKDIRKRCRMSMNGVASASMKAHGLDYKVNFGVSIAEIKQIASRYKPNRALSEILWKDEARELQILGTMLYPLSEFDDEVARRWVSEIPNQEIREQLGVNVFQFLSSTYSLGQEFANSRDEGIRTSGYWFLGKYLIKYPPKEDIDLSSFNQIINDLVSKDIFLRNAARFFLRNVGRVSREHVNVVLNKISDFKDSEDSLKREIYHVLAIDFKFFYENI